MSVFIATFQPAKDIDEFRYFYGCIGQDNLDALIKDATIDHETVWTVPINSECGDTIVFYCARTADQHMGHVLAQARTEGNKNMIELVEKQRAKYKKCAGKILAIGNIAEMPRIDFEYGLRTCVAKITNLRLLNEFVDISEFKGVININKFGAHTKLNDWQWECLQQYI